MADHKRTKSIARNKKAVITTAAVNKILLEMGAKMSAPVRERFLRSAQVCFDWYGDAILYTHGAPQREHVAFATELRAATNYFASLLDERRVPNSLSHFVNDFAPVADLRTRLEKLDSDLKRVAELRSDSKPRTGLEKDFIETLTYQDHFKERSPFDWLAGVYLPELYFLFFGFKSGWAKGGKFLTFVEIVLREMGVKTAQGKFYRRQAISRATRVLRDSKARRKRGPLIDGDTPDQMEWYRHMYFMQAIGGVRYKSSLESARKVLVDLGTEKVGR